MVFNRFLIASTESANWSYGTEIFLSLGATVWKAMPSY